MNQKKIENYKKAVIAALSGKRKVVTRPMRNVRYKAINQLSCDKCKAMFQNNSQLSIHMSTSHTTIKQTATEAKFPMIDDLSLMDLSTEADSEVNHKLELEEICESSNIALLPPATDSSVGISEVIDTTVKISCTKCEMNFSSTENFKQHQEKHNVNSREPMQTKTDDLVETPETNCNVLNSSPKTSLMVYLACPFCNLNSKNVEMLQLHIGNIHFKNQPEVNTEINQITVISRENCYNCEVCPYVGTEQALQQHIKREHGKPKKEA